MKNSSFFYTKTPNAWMVVFFALLTSCEQYNFYYAQPVDKGNIYSFPNELLGKWVAVNSSDSEIYTVKPTYAIYSYIERRDIVKGAWPKPDEKGNLIYPRIFTPFQTINYDSLKKPVDTTDNYFIRGDKIFEIPEKEILEPAFSYYSVNDTIHAERTDSLCIDLGQNAFLRKLAKNYYALNIRNMVLGEGSRWWQLLIIRFNENSSVEVLMPSDKMSEHPSVFYLPYSKHNMIYIDATLSTADLLELIRKGYFKTAKTLIR